MEGGLRSADAFVVRRCQIVLASEYGAGVPRIARQVGCSDQPVRNVSARFQYPGRGVSAARALTAPHHARALGGRGSPEIGRASCRERV